MRNPEYRRGNDALNVDPEYLSSKPGPLKVVNIGSYDREVHKSQLEQGVAIKFFVELVFKLQGAGKGLGIEEAGVLESEKLEREKASN